MSTNYDCVNTKCPFYMGETVIKISCEGIFKNAAISSTFKTGEGKKRHKKYYCNNLYKYCPLYKSICQKYGEGDKNVT